VAIPPKAAVPLALRQIKADSPKRHKMRSQLDCSSFTLEKHNHVETDHHGMSGSPTEWEWRVCDAAGQPLRIGWQRSRNVAKQEGERALFKLIGSGGTTYSIPKNMLTRGH
jgi:hypothetical protein